MYKIIGADQKEYGPVTEDQINQWISEGRANLHTRIQVEGQNDWQPLGSLAEFAGRFGPAPPLADAPGTFARPAQILAADYQIDIGQLLKHSWELLQAHFWPMIGVTLLIWLLIGVCGAVPRIGSLLNLVVAGPLMGGLWIYFLRLLRGQSPGVNEAFSGFGPRFGQLLGAYVATSLLTLLSAIIGIAAVALGLVFGILPVPLAVLLALVGFLPPIYLSVCWMFTLPLVADQGLDFWPAMELSRRRVSQHWWALLLLTVVGTLLAILGLILCMVGVLATGPLVMAMMAYAYEELFIRTPAPIA